MRNEYLKTLFSRRMSCDRGADSLKRKREENKKCTHKCHKLWKLRLIASPFYILLCNVLCVMIMLYGGWKVEHLRTKNFPFYKFLTYMLFCAIKEENLLCFLKVKFNNDNKRKCFNFFNEILANFFFSKAQIYPNRIIYYNFPINNLFIFSATSPSKSRDSFSLCEDFYQQGKIWNGVLKEKEIAMGEFMEKKYRLLSMNIKVCRCWKSNFSIFWGGCS